MTFLFIAELPPTAETMRVVVRDTGNGRVGTADFVVRQASVGGRQDKLILPLPELHDSIKVAQAAAVAALAHSSGATASTCFTILAGVPTTTLYGGTSRVTALLAPTIAPA
ncbi:MAG: hypothetical protein WAN65_15275, partial [Candidatus Sulfotelmatobacter sp.]